VDSTDRYFLIATGVNHYEAAGFDHLSKVRRDVWAVARVFVRNFGYTRMLPEVALNPTADDFRLALRTWVLRQDSKPSDVVVVYFAGHGYVSNSLDHYLCFRTFTTKDPRSTGLRASDLTALFFEGERDAPENVWLILDSCYSGAGAAQAQTEAARLLEQARPNACGGFWVLASARSNEGARDGAFAPLFYRIATQRLNDPAYAGAMADLLRPDGIADELNRRFKAEGMPQRSLLSATAVGQLFPFFPNPRNKSRMIGMDIENQRKVWLEKARGAGPVEVGEFFSGRTVTLQQLTEWLHARQSDLQMRVVSGDMGSGKSAVLGRLVGTQSVSLAIDARQLTSWQVQALIARALEVPADNFLDILDRLHKRQAPFILVVDGLDEAKEPERIAHVLLQPLGAHPMVRLIVGTRRNLLNALGKSVKLIDLDVPPYWQPEDLQRYVQTRLTQGTSPRSAQYSDERSVRLIVSVIAPEVGTSFLLARLTTRNVLRQKPLIDPSAFGWEDRLRSLLPRTVEEAYETDFVRFDTDQQTVRDVLLPLVYAKGRGLPWGGIWGAVSSEIAGRELRESELEHVQDIAGFYIVADNEQGVAVYRLFHKSLETFLKRDANDTEIEQLVVKALRQAVPCREGGGKMDWLHETRPYVRDYLAMHAAAGGILGELIQDPAYVAIANPDILQEVMRRNGSQVAPEIRSTHEGVIHHLRESIPSESLSYLELSARVYGFPDWADRIAGAVERRAWDVPWMVWTYESPHRKIRAPNWKSSPAGFLTSKWSVEAGVFQDDPVIFSGDLDGTLRIWNANTAAPKAEPVKLYEHEFSCIAPFSADNRLLMFTASQYGEVDAIDPYDPAWRVSSSFGGYRVNAVAVIQLGGRTLCACGLQNAVRLWDPITGEIVGNSLEIANTAVYAIGALPSGDAACLLAGGGTGELCLCRLGGEGVLTEPESLSRQQEAIVRIGTAYQDGIPVFVSISSDGRVCIWDCDGNQINTFKTGHTTTQTRNWIQTAAVGSIDGVNAIAAADFDGFIRIMDLASGLLLRQPLRGHTDVLLGLTIGERDGEPYLASSGADGTIRIWDYRAAESGVQRTADPHMRSVELVSTADNNNALVVCGDIDGTISVRSLYDGVESGESFDKQFEAVNDLVSVRIGSSYRIFSASGKNIHVWDLAQRQWVKSWQAGTNMIQQLALGRPRGSPVIASASHDGSVGIWDASSGTPVYPRVKHPDEVFAVCIARLMTEDQHVLSGCFDGKIRIFDLATGSAVGSPLVGHTGPVVSIIVGEWNERRVIISGSWDGTIRLWDADQRTPLDEPLAAHNGSVNSIALLQIRTEQLLVSGGLMASFASGEHNVTQQRALIWIATY
jgi:WD40 repeat protein